MYVIDINNQQSVINYHDSIFIISDALHYKMLFPPPPTHPTQKMKNNEITNKLKNNKKPKKNKTK